MWNLVEGSASLGQVEAQGVRVKDRCSEEREDQTRVRGKRILLCIMRSNLILEIRVSGIPDFRLRYNDEKVANEPTNMPRYAKGTASPTQSTIACRMESFCAARNWPVFQIRRWLCEEGVCLVNE